MLLHRNHRCPAFTVPFHRFLRLSGLCFSVLWPNKRASSTLSRCTSKQVRRRAFQSSGIQRNPSAPSSLNVQPFVKDPFTILFCGRDLFSCAVFKEVHNAKGEFFKTSKRIEDASNVHGSPVPQADARVVHSNAEPLRLCSSCLPYSTPRS